MTTMFRILILALAGLMLAGCDRKAVLFSGLEERQANPVLAALMSNAIPCEKSPGAEENTWTVTLNSSKDFARAVEICQERGLPERVFKGVSETFRKTGMVSSPTEERIRFMDALSQDLSRTISEIDGVVSARVHVVLPNNDPFAKNTLPSSAAVAIRCRYDVDMTDVLPQIKNLVMNSIEGLAYEKIAVTVFRDSPAIVVARNVNKNALADQPLNDPVVLRWLVAACAALAVLLAVLVIVGVLWLRRISRQAAATAPAEESA